MGRTGDRGSVLSHEGRTGASLCFPSLLSKGKMFLSKKEHRARLRQAGPRPGPVRLPPAEPEAVRTGPRRGPSPSLPALLPSGRRPPRTRLQPPPAAFPGRSAAPPEVTPLLFVLSPGTLRTSRDDHEAPPRLPLPRSLRLPRHRPSSPRPPRTPGHRAPPATSSRTANPTVASDSRWPRVGGQWGACTCSGREAAPTPGAPKQEGRPRVQRGSPGRELLRF